MHNVMKVSLVATLLAGMLGCSGATPEEAAAEARVTAADARISVADADARVTAADARVRVADALVAAANADARVAAGTRVAAATSGSAPDSGAVIPSGTPFKISLIDALDSGTSSAGDRFLASLSESIVVNGITVLPAGTTLRGRVVEVESAGRVQGLATMSLALTDIVRGDQSSPITTETLAVSSEPTRARDAGIIAGGAGVGAAVGAIAGGAKGAAIGAATGGGAGTGVVLATRGEEIQYGPETRLTFTLMNPISM